MADKRTHTSSILSFQAISKEQFEALFCHFYPQVVAYTTKILNDAVAGEDITQEIFVSVWEKRKKLQMNDGFQSYLFQSAYSRCIDYIRKNKLMARYEQQSLLVFAEEYHRYLENDCQVMKDLYSKDFNEKLNALLAQLPKARREVFEMMYREGLKTKEIAAKLQIPTRTVESHVYLTMKHLRKHLSLSDLFILTFFLSFF